MYFLSYILRVKMKSTNIIILNMQKFWFPKRRISVPFRP